MSFVVPKSTALVVMFKAFLKSDHVTEATGKTIAITISKNGGAFASPSAGATNATAVSNGWYSVTLSTTDTNTAGPLAVLGIGSLADIDEVGDRYFVTDYTAIADAILDRDLAAGVDTGVASGAGSRTVRQALRFSRNKWSVTGGVMTVTKEDDTTASWAAAVTGTAGADPITSVDPT